jgi:uncharacterized protein YabE (DUF348 family)
MRDVLINIDKANGKNKKLMTTLDSVTEIIQEGANLIDIDNIISQNTTRSKLNGTLMSNLST